MDSQGDRPTETTAVLVVGDIRLYREGVAQILDRGDRVAVAGTASGWEEALQRAIALEPSVTLVDMAMTDALATVRSLVEVVPSMKIVALAVPDSESDVIACAEAGVSGYVTRQASIEDLVAMIESVRRGEMPCSPRIAAGLVRRVKVLAAEHAPGEDPHLTTREIQIAGLIDEGLSNKEIAQRLCIELSTVKNHVHNLLEKLGVHRRGEAAARLRARTPPFARPLRQDSAA